MELLNCELLGTRRVNQALRQLGGRSSARVLEPGGRHNLAVGVASPSSIVIEGNGGYFVGALCGTRDGTGPNILVEGFVGWSVGENLMGGTVRVRGSASESAGASAHGGTVVVDGNASMRAGISLKGGTVVIGGNAGPMTGFLAQAGTILIGGDAGAALGDSLYEAVIYVAGRIASLGADAREEELTDDDVLEVKRLVTSTGFDHIDPTSVRKVASARQLYHFSSHHLEAY